MTAGVIASGSVIFRFAPAFTRTRTESRAPSREAYRRGVNPPLGRLETRLPFAGLLISSTLDCASTSVPASTRILAAAKLKVGREEFRNELTPVFLQQTRRTLESASGPE